MKNFMNLCSKLVSLIAETLKDTALNNVTMGTTYQGMDVLAVCLTLAGLVSETNAVLIAMMDSS